MKNIKFLVIAIVYAITSCSSGAKKDTVTPFSDAALSDIIFHKSNGAIDSFHIILDGFKFSSASSASFKVTVGHGAGTATRNLITDYEIRGTSLNSIFSGTTTITIGYYEVGGQTVVGGIIGTQTDSTNLLFGRYSYSLLYYPITETSNNYSASYYHNNDTMKVVSGTDTTICVVVTGGSAPGTTDLDALSRWIIECTEGFSNVKFGDYTTYNLVNYGAYLISATYYKNHVFQSSYNYNYMVDQNNKVTQQTVTDNLGNVNSITYKYK